MKKDKKDPTKIQTSENRNAATGIPGLDDILRGGFPENRLFVIQGQPGTGKTTLALQFLLQGVSQGERGLYIALSETSDELEVVAKSHGMSLDSIAVFELSSLEEKMAVESQNTLFHPAEVELTKTTQILIDEVQKVKPRRVVLDSLSELRLLAQNSLRFRRQILALKQFFSQAGCTVILLDDLTSENFDLQIKSIAHGVLTLEQLSPDFGPARRRLILHKLRGVEYRSGFHDFMIRPGGLTVFPRLVAAEHRAVPMERNISSGIKELDALLGGGIDQGTSTLILGPSGGGKSNIAMQYAIAAAERGEVSFIYSFDEGLGTILKRAHSVSLPLEKYLESGLIKIVLVDPAEMSPGEFIQRIRDSVENDDARIVIIDSLNGYLNAMPEERHLAIQLHELLTFLNQRGVASFLLFAQHGMLGAVRSAVDLTYLSDSVILIRNFEYRGTLNKAVSVIKKRTGPHEDTIRELKFEGGVKVGRPLNNFHGVLTGIPNYYTSSSPDSESI